MQLVSPLPFSCIKHSDHVTCKLIQRDKASKTTTPEDNAFFLKRKNELPQAGFDCTCVDRVNVGLLLLLFFVLMWTNVMLLLVLRKC